MLSCLVLGAGCGGVGPATPVAPSLERDPAGFVASVAAFRKLEQLGPIEVRWYDRAAFDEALRRLTPRRAKAARPEIEASLLSALGFGRVKLDSVAQRLTVGAYDPGSKEVLLVRPAKGSRGPVPAAAISDQEDSAIHEVVHALQDQHFSFGEHLAGDVDRLLAESALIEGDATWVETTMVATRHFVSSRLFLSDSPYPEDAESEPRSRWSASRDEDRVSRLLFFPYRAGRWFSGVLVRSGGFALLDAAYRSPPRTTEQVLHPEKYLRGEGAVPVATPEPEDGTTVLVSGHLGEFMLRTVLLTCNGPADAKRAAEGWGGDAYTLATRKETTQLRLVTTWDRETDAVEFESALRRTTACWDGGEPFRSEYDGPTGVEREGQTVVLVRGARDGFRDFDRGIGLEPELARPLFERVGRPLPPVEPLGHVVARLPPPLPRVEADVVRGESVVSTRFGIEIPVPKDWDVKAAADIRLGIVEGLPPALRVALVWRTFDAESVGAIVEDRSSGVSAGLEALEPGHEDERFVEEIRTRSMPVGRGFEVGFVFRHRLRGDGRVVELPDRVRAIIVPVCDGAGALVLTESWATPSDESELDEVLAGIRALPGGPALCPAPLP